MESLLDLLRLELRKFGCAHEALWIYEELQSLSETQAIKKASDIIRRRSLGEPLAYILGHWDFRKLRLSVGPGVLIPRPETEEMVDVAAAHIGRLSKKHIVVADFGAGTGAIGFSLISESSDELQLFSIERSADAFFYLTKNLRCVPKKKQKQIQLVNKSWENFGEKVDLILSNPPYVSRAEYTDLDLSVSSFEPAEALVPEGDSAFAAYESIFQVAHKILRAQGAVIVEFGPAQADDWAKNVPPEYKWEIFKDLSGKPRFLYCFDFSPKTH